MTRAKVLRIRGGESLDAAANAAASGHGSQRLKLHLAGKLLPALKETFKLAPNAGAAVHNILDATLISVLIYTANFLDQNLPS